MAAFGSGFNKLLLGTNACRIPTILQRQEIISCNVRRNHMFRYLQKEKEHDTKYEYEVSRDPEEWKFVEKLLPYEVVPEPKLKSKYPSGWRPQSDESLKHDYFVERSKNHMLSVYLDNRSRGQLKVTRIKRIHGNLWKFHNELKDHIEKQIGKRITSCVHEGNMTIDFKGDHVYYVEQWLLAKGF